MPKAIIMAGGQGERFWPMTHDQFPKYRIKLHGKDSLLQKTCKRLLKVYSADSIYVVTTQSHLKLIQEELPGLKSQNILIEPFRNNTAAAIFLSCELIRHKFGDDEVISFFPADHLIEHEDEFKKTMHSTIRLAKTKDLLVTVGIQPTFPATGYGYIEAGQKIMGLSSARYVKRFVEKPDLAKAKKYIKKKNYFWNAGIFTWRTGVFLSAIKKHSPEFPKNINLKDLKGSYKKLPNLSIDYALMEKARNIAIVETRMDWCDMGNWDMYFEKMPINKEENFLSTGVHQKKSRRTLLLNQTDKPLIVLGVEDLVVVQTPWGTLVCKRERSEEAALFYKKIQ